MAPPPPTFIFSAILHDSNNPTAIRILRDVAGAAAPGAHVILIDLVVPENDAPLTTRISHLTMMAMIGGRRAHRVAVAPTARSGRFHRTAPHIGLGNVLHHRGNSERLEHGLAGGNSERN